MTDMLIKGYWKKLYEENKMSIGMADCNDHASIIGEFNARLYRELLQKQKKGRRFLNQDEIREFLVKVADKAEHAVITGGDPDRLWVDKIIEAICSSEMMTMMEDHNEVGVFDKYSLKVKAVVPCGFLTSKEVQVAETALGGEYIEEFGAMELTVLQVPLYFNISPQKQDQIYDYCRRLMLDALRRHFEQEYPEQKVPFRYGLLNRIKDYFLDQSI